MQPSVYKPCSSIIVSQSSSLRAHATTVNSNSQNSRALINQPELITRSLHALIACDGRGQEEMPKRKDDRCLHGQTEWLQNNLFCGCLSQIFIVHMSIH